MKSQKIIYSLWALMLIAVTLSSVLAQKVTHMEEPVSNSVNLAQSNAPLEEKIVRMAYRKMNILDTVERFMRAERNGQPADRELGLLSLRFNLRNFRVGDIQEIQNAAYRNLVTLPEGQIIQASVLNSTQLSGEIKISLDADWVTGQNLLDFNPQRTISEIMRHEAHRFGDVDRYASYEVAVSLNGKTRTYRALALFHNPNQPEGIPRPEFLDNVVGLNGIVTQVSREIRLPLGLRPSSVQTTSQNNNFTDTLTKTKGCSNQKTPPIEQNLVAPPEGGGGACLEWYYTPIDPTYTYCMVWDPYYYGGGGGGYEIIQGGSNDIYYSYDHEEIVSILGLGVKRCIYDACFNTNRNPSNGCFDASYETFVDIRNIGDTCSLGIRATYTRYRVPLLGYTYCDRDSHADLRWNPCL